MALSGTLSIAGKAGVRSIPYPLSLTSVRVRQYAPVNQSLLLRKADHCACGGGCPRCQAKSNGLRVSQPNDPAEKEADRIADAVMRMTKGGAETMKPVEPTLRYGEASGERILQAQGAMRAASPQGDSTAATDSVYETIKAPGQPLPTEIRAFFEPRIGRNMSHVRIHTSEKAQQSARELNALAYTIGSHVVFNAGEYKPYSSGGRRLLAHELIHVVQQTAKPVIGLDRRSDPSVAPVISKEVRPMIQRSGPAVGEVAPMPTEILFIGQEASLLDSAAEGAKVLAKLPQGSSVKLVSVHDDWYVVEAQVTGGSIIGFIESRNVQSPPMLEGQQISDPVTNTFAKAMGAEAEMVWVPHPDNPKYEVAVCDTGFVSLIYAREVANPAVILQTTMNDATKTPVENWGPAKTIQCRSAP